MNVLNKIVSEKLKYNIQPAFEKEYRKPNPELVEQYKKNLFSSQYVDKLNYLKDQRGFTEGTIQHFNLGYNPDKDAIAIPEYKNDELINFQYRLLSPEAKTKYIRESGCETWVYNEDGIEQAKQKGAVLITEGQFDLISVWQSGIKNVVSVSSGKDSYGVWINKLDAIPRIYICFDNDKAGIKSAQELYLRFSSCGQDDVYNVKLPEGVKDANDFLKSYQSQDFRDLIKESKHFYRNIFRKAEDLFDELYLEAEAGVEIKSMPGVTLFEDTLTVISGKTNAGKSTYAMNILIDMGKLGWNCLYMPFERYSQAMLRYNTVFLDSTTNEIRKDYQEYRKKLVKNATDGDIYFSCPRYAEWEQTVRMAKKIFNVQAVFIDHIDYIAGGMASETKQSKYDIQEQLMLHMKTLSQELDIRFILLQHIKKGGKFMGKDRELSSEDIKGSSTIGDVAENIIFVYREYQPDFGEIIGNIKIQMEKVKFGASNGKSFIFQDRPETGTIYFDKPVDELKPLPNKKEVEEKYKNWN